MAVIVTWDVFLLRSDWIVCFRGDGKSGQWETEDNAYSLFSLLKECQAALLWTRIYFLGATCPEIGVCEEKWRTLMNAVMSPWIRSSAGNVLITWETILWTVSLVGIAMDRRGSISGRGKRFFSSSQLVYRLWGPPSFLFNGYRRLFPRG
jgi:hypothetical protein